jgi:hypothetical protein
VTCNGVGRQCRAEKGFDSLNGNQVGKPAIRSVASRYVRHASSSQMSSELGFVPPCDPLEMLDSRPLFVERMHLSGHASKARFQHQ